MIRPAHHRSRSALWLSVAAAWLAFATLGGGVARAATTATIPGSPLTIYADDNGRLQAVFPGAASGEFYPGTMVPGDGGLTVAINTGNAFSVFGLRGTPFTSVTAPVVSGNGSAASPWTVTTSFQATTSLRVDERVVYINGTTEFGVQYTVTNTSVTGGTVNVRLYESADILPAGGYAASGFLTGVAPTRRVGGAGLYNGVGGSGSLLEIDPWSAFEEAYSGTVDAAIGSISLATGLSNTVASGVETRGAGVAAQWDVGVLGPSGSASRSTAWFFNRTSALQLVAPPTTQTAGQTARIPVTARNNDGGPDAGRSVRYTITGANPGSGAVTTAADGTGVISWLGAKVGTDTLTAFVDRDGNGTWDVNTEPRQIVTVTFAPLPPPVPGKSVNVNVVSGQVFVKLPGGSGRATGPAKGYVPLTGQLQIPVGSQLDTRKGRVNLTSAADTGGKKTQASNFYDGIFAVKQALPKVKKKKGKAVALTTDIVLKGQISRSQCAPLKGASAAVAKKKKGPKSVLGKLWGNGKGKFRTTGKYSAATVRGTIWLTQDECDGTLTKVRRGTVLVRDLKRKKTVTVKAGHSYLARAQRAASKSRRK